jgi:GT2 family glycosyltransferase
VELRRVPGGLTPGGGPADVSVCVPVWKAHRPPNLASLAASLPAALQGLKGELVVVLNGVAQSQLTIPSDARIVVFSENRGVSAGWNQAAAVASAPVLCFANDDLEFGPGSLRRLWATASGRADAGVVGPVGTEWDIGAARHLRYLSVSHLAPGDVAECDVLSGFLLCTRRDVFDAAGGFDEAYTPCSFEEVDYCTTVRLKLGLRCLVVAGVEVKHEFGISARRPWRRVRYLGRSESLGSIARRNRQYFLTKWSDSARGPRDG